MSDASMFRTIRPSTVWSAAVDQIKERIDSGELPAGSRLPSERELGRVLGISRVSVREAMRALEAIGYVEIRPGTGTYVIGAPAPNGAALRTWLRDHDDHVRKLFELRETVEPGLARLAARHADAALVAELRATVDELRAAGEADDLFRGIAADAEFHRLLAQRTGNSIIDGLIGEVMHATGQERRVSLRVPGQMERAVQGHQEILDAISQGDEELAEHAMRRHLVDAMRFIESYTGPVRRSATTEKP